MRWLIKFECALMSLKHAILAALSRKPQTGYELSREIEGSIGYFWNATHQQIYKKLHALEAEGWLGLREVEQSDKPDKKIYRVTAEGLKELREWIAQEAELPPAKDALLIKLFGAHLVAPEVMLAVFEMQYEKRATRLKRYLEIEKRHFKGKKLSLEMQFEYLTVRRGIIFERAWAAWANESISVIRKRMV